MSASRAVLLAAAVALVALPAHAASDGFARITVPVTPRVHLIQRPIATNAPYEGNVEVIEQSILPPDRPEVGFG